MSEARAFKIASLLAIDPWTFSEMGGKLAKKKHKKMMNRKRRTIEKRELEREEET